MDNYSDFSTFEQRQLSLIERELVTDRRLVALMAVLGARGTRMWRRLRCFAIRFGFASRMRNRRCVVRRSF
ncbi:MAG TPA: hypothetical protein VFW65_27645 [Pseudonocardiaceae bacterium]|nr:hypothetical protein [Pseudonocardiaceae bacterium]